MKTIWKYEVSVAAEVSIPMPEGAVILPHVQMLHSEAMNIWAIVDPDAPAKEKTVHVVGTGHPMHRYLGQYLGTATDGTLVWHVFEEAS